MHELKVRPYLPFWFRSYVICLGLFSELSGMSIDKQKLEAKAIKATKLKVIHE
jgi:hypothetical protein